MKFVWCNKAMKWVEPAAVQARSVHIIGDECEHVSALDGKGYSSKSEYRRSLKDAGYVELGNDRLPLEKPFTPTGIGDELRRVAYERGHRF